MSSSVISQCSNGILPMANAVRWIIKGVPQYTLDVSEVPTPIWQTAQSLQEITPGYFIRRTALGKMLPVYTAFSHGWSKKQTIVRRIDGDPEALARELSIFIPAERIELSKARGNLVIKGIWAEQIKQYLTLRGF